MVKIWGKIVTNNKIIKDQVVISDKAGSYQDNLKECINKLCQEFDISKPYWLPINLDEYNKRSKTTFTAHNFMDEIDFDKFIIAEIDTENSHR